jgi:hypothetical protein
VEHSEGKGGESDVAILRFLCGSPNLCQLRTASLWPRWQALSCVLTACRVLWGPISRVAFVITMSNRTSLLRVVPPGVKRMACLSGSSPVGCISIRIAVTLSVMSGSLSLMSSRSMFGVLW